MIRATFLGLLFTTFLFTSSLFAQDNAAPSAGAPGCGAPDTKFDVKTAEGQHPAQPEAGDRKSIRLNSSHQSVSRMPSSA